MKLQQPQQERRASSRGVFGTIRHGSTLARGSATPSKLLPSSLIIDNDDPYASQVSKAPRMMVNQVKPSYRLMTSAFVQRRGTVPALRVPLGGTLGLQPSIYDTDANILAKRCRIRDALEKIKGDQLRLNATMKNKRNHEPLVATKQEIFSLGKIKTRNDRQQSSDQAFRSVREQVTPLPEQQNSSQPSVQGNVSFDGAKNTKAHKSNVMDNFDLRNRNQTKKILVTDVNKYLDEDNESPHKNCISCAKCLALKRKVLQFKYSKQLKSTYKGEIQERQDRSSSPIHNPAAARPNQTYNYDAIRRQLRVAYEPPRQMVTSYTNNFVNTKGTEMIGALDQEGKKAQPSLSRKSPPKLTQDPVPLKFQALSHSAITHAGTGRMPTPNMRVKVPLTTGFGRFYGETSYTSCFDNRQQQDTSIKEGFLATRSHAKDYRGRAQKGTGSLSPPRQLPNISPCAAE